MNLLVLVLRGLQPRWIIKVYTWMWNCGNSLSYGLCYPGANSLLQTGKIIKWKKAGEEFACNAGHLASIPGLGRFHGEGKGYSLQCSGLENSMDCIDYRVAKSRTWLSDWTELNWTEWLVMSNIFSSAAYWSFVYLLLRSIYSSPLSIFNGALVFLLWIIGALYIFWILSTLSDIWFAMEASLSWL